jgi:hypothetical protein
MERTRNAKDEVGDGEVSESWRREGNIEQKTRRRREMEGMAWFSTNLIEGRGKEVEVPEKIGTGEGIGMIETEEKTGIAIVMVVMVVIAIRIQTTAIETGKITIEDDKNYVASKLSNVKIQNISTRLLGPLIIS